MKSKDENPCRQPNRSKNPARVDRQLEALKAASADDANDTEIAPTAGEAVKDGQGIAEKTAQASQAEFTRGQLGKARRAFAKAGQPDASEEVRKKWLAEMGAANVAVMKFSSSRLAKGD